MTININTQQDVSIVELPARLVQQNAATVRQAIYQHIEAGNPFILLDLGETEFVDSSGLAVLVAAYKAVQPQAGAVHLLNPNNNVLALIELTRLHQIFDIFQDKATAIFDLRGQPATTQE